MSDRMQALLIVYLIIALLALLYLWEPTVYQPYANPSYV